MRAISKRDKGVSEVIGFVLIFAIVISLFSTLVTYYVPATESAYEHDYQAASMYAMSKLSNTLSTPGYIPGQVLNNYVPLGIQGGVFSPGRQTSLIYSSGGMSGSLSYVMGLQYAYTQQHPTNAVLNKLLKTFPRSTLTDPVAELYNNLASPGYLYVAGYQSNNVAVIDPIHGNIVNYVYAGSQPKAMVFGPGNTMIYVLDNLTSVAKSYSFFTVSEIRTTNNTFVANAIIENSSINQPRPDIFDVSAITYGSGNIYVSYQYHVSNSKVYHYRLAQINASSLQVTNIVKITGGNLFDLAYDQNYGDIVGLMNASLASALPEYTVIDPTTMSVVASVPIDFQAFYSLYGYDNATGGVSQVSSGNNYSSYLTSGGATVSLQNVYPDGAYLYFSFNITSPTQMQMNSYTGNRYDLPAPGVVSVNFSTSNLSESIFRIAQFYAGTTITPAVISDSSMYSGTPTLNLGGIAFSPALTTDFVYDFNLSGYYNFNSTNVVNVTNRATDIVAFPSLSGSTAYYSITSSSASTETIYQINDSNLSYFRLIWNSYFNEPYAAAYDPVNFQLYVTNYGSGTITILNPNTDALISSIFLGKGVTVTNLTVNTNTGTVYVIEANMHALAVINGTNLSTLIPLDASPVGISYDPLYNSTYVSCVDSAGAEFLNISGINVTEKSTLNVSKTTNLIIGPIAYDSFTNRSYAAIGTSTSNGKGAPYSWYLYELGAILQGKKQPITLTDVASPTVGIAFNDYTGSLYVSDYASNELFIYPTFYSTSVSKTFTPSLALSVGTGPTGVTFDGGNNLLYVSNSASSNLTVIDTTNNSVLSTIWIGSGPMFSTFDPDNGYVFIPDYGSNQLSVIDGGFTVFQGERGVSEIRSSNVGGTISTFGNTVFATPENYIIQNGALISNVTNSNISRTLQGIPFSIINESGGIYFSDVSTSLVIPSGSSSVSISSNSPTDIKTLVSSVINDTYTVGTNFFITDVYGNNYPAVVTGLYMTSFSLSLVTGYATSLNNFLYHYYYTGNSGTANLSWKVPGLPMQVSLIGGNSLTFTLSKPISLHFVSIQVYQISLLEM